MPLNFMTVYSTHTHPFNGPLSGTTRVSWYQKGKTNLDFTEARDSEWQWDQLDHMQVCTSLETDNHASTPPLSFLQAGCPSCRPTNSVKALKAVMMVYKSVYYYYYTFGHAMDASGGIMFSGCPSVCVCVHTCLGRSIPNWIAVSSS